MSKGDRIPLFLKVIDSFIGQVEELAKDNGLDSLMFDSTSVKKCAANLFDDVVTNIAKKASKDKCQIRAELEELYSEWESISNESKCHFSVMSKRVLSDLDDWIDVIECYAQNQGVDCTLSFDNEGFISFVEKYINSVFDAIIKKTHKEWEQINKELCLKNVSKSNCRTNR